jgi:hypothetical protein
MEDAVRRGLDRATILQSIDASLNVGARSGALSLSVDGMSDLSMKLSDLPGGHTADLAATVAGQYNDSMSTIGQNPTRTLMAMNMMNKIKTEGDVANLLGGSLPDSDEGRHAVKMLLLSGAKKDGLAFSKWLNVVTRNNTAAQDKVYSQSEFYAGVPEQWQDISKAGVAGTDVSTQLAFRFGSGVDRPSTRPGGGDYGPARSAGVNMPPGGAAWQDGKEQEYRLGLLLMGVKPELIGDLIAEGKNAGIDPRIAGAVMMNESSGGFDKKLGDAGKRWLAKGGLGTPANVNVMQISPTSGMPEPSTIHESIVEGYAHLKNDFAASKGSLYGAMRGYNGPGMPDSYADAITTNLAQSGFFEGLPAGNTAYPANAGQAQLAGSDYTYSLTHSAVDRANHEIDRFSKALKRATDSINSIPLSMGGPNLIVP